MQKKDISVDFTQGPVFPELLKFTYPIVLANLLQISYNMVDLTIVGYAAHKAGTSAVSVGGDVVGFLTYIVIGFASAGQIMISHYLGAKKNRDVGKFIGTMFLFLMIVAVSLSAVCLILREPILRVMNTPPEAFEQALKYSTICMFGLVFIYGYNIGSAILRGFGDSRHPLMFVGISAGTNVVLDLVFVAGLKMNAAGAAYATVISQAFSFICCVIFVMKNQDRIGVTFMLRDFLHLDREMLVNFIKLGVPMALKTAAVHISKLLVNSLINSYGVAVSAFAGVASKLVSMGNMVSQAMNTGGATMVGQNIGAEKYDRVPRILKAVFQITVVIAIAFSAVLILSPNTLYGLFTPDAEVLEVGAAYVPIGVLAFFGGALRATFNALLNGCANSRLNLLVAVLDALILRVGLTLLFGLGFGWGYLGFWLGDVTAGYTPFFIGLVYYFSGRWKKKTVTA